ncbi:hypothetical protein D6779_05090, partial [Candidatus Parcubacteria bacterium]
PVAVCIQISPMPSDAQDIVDHDFNQSFIVIKPRPDTLPKLEEILAHGREQEEDAPHTTPSFSRLWATQFKEALHFDSESATSFQGVLHGLSLPWKILFALIPPPSIYHGWPCFVLSITFIGTLTAIVRDPAVLLGYEFCLFVLHSRCVLGIPDVLTATTLVALGTSLPDTFASRQAAIDEDNADAAIGNVTGSSSVNVVLGLGLPALIASAYYTARGEKFCMPADRLGGSVLAFPVLAVSAIGALTLRRYVPSLGGAELGGRWRWWFGIFFLSLWLLYIGYSVAVFYKGIPEF